MLSIQNYAERTARIMGVKIPEDFEKHFANLSEVATRDHQGEVNRILASVPAETPEIPASVVTSLRAVGEAAYGQGFKTYVNDLNERKASYIINHREYIRRAGAELTQARSIDDQLAILKNAPTPAPIVQVIEEIHKKTFFKLMPNQSRLPAITFNTPDIVMKNTIPGSRPRPMGQFEIVFRLDSVQGAFKARMLRNNNISRNGKYHPFMNGGSESEICFGSAQETVDLLVMKRDYVNAFQLLQGVLTQYDANAYPYVRLEDFPTTLDHMCGICNCRLENCGGCRNCYAPHSKCACRPCRSEGCTTKVVSVENGGPEDPLCFQHIVPVQSEEEPDEDEADEERDPWEDASEDAV